ncbi:MAG: ethanolamine ammonia-lyase reactivating factor EutA [Pseudomonadota bacterium]|nr:ethanolamine ammonia-lyase reactivating factor EutA [Pseudomonadota bacterium]
MSDQNSPPSKRNHSLEDHLYGEGFNHVHGEGEDADHDHDHFEDAGPLEENPLWLADHVTLKSVGIDIGSSGTQVIFSELKLRRLGEDLSSRYVVTSRETLHQSPVALTPYANEERIDEARLGAIIDDAYNAANIHPDDIDTGVVILTGEALRRENAQAIAGVLAEAGGEFVCATAGHHMEAMLAAYGSGAARVSHDMQKRILNIDIGGGTTKLGLVESGRVIGTAAVHIGGRLQVVDEQHRITRLDSAGAYHARQAGFEWQRGDIAMPEALDEVAQRMADTLISAVSARPLSADVRRLYLTEPLRDIDGIAGVMFSGGVAEYVYEREARDFGDMGRRLGTAIRQRIAAGALPWALLPAGECIRATALGASEYSVQLSGNTVYISDPATLLPRKNLQVLLPNVTLGHDIDARAVADAIREHFVAFDLNEGETEVALAFRWQGAPSFQRVATFAKGIRDGLPRTISAGKPIFIVLDGDVAQTLGGILREDLGVASELLVIDGITLWDFDYIDLGRIRMPSFTVPVTVKSLVFSEDPRLVPGQNDYRADRKAAAHDATDHRHSAGAAHYRAHHHGSHDHDHGHSHGGGTHDHHHDGDGHDHSHDHPHGDSRTVPAALRGAGGARPGKETKP